MKFSKKCCNVFGTASSNVRRQVEKMIKLRHANYCNLKLFLIFLVIYGHFIEPRIEESAILMVQYRWIYLVHMPLFSFMSGLFISKEKDCAVQLKRSFPIYLLLQSIAGLFGKGRVEFLRPVWILWYLLSYSTWLCFAWLWLRFCKKKYKILILICGIAVACLGGFVPWIDRKLSLSRTLVFFPYFFAGVITEPSFYWRGLRTVGIASFIVAFVIMLFVGNDIPTTFLYQASPYERKTDVLLRLICYILGGSLGLFLLSVSPDKRLPFTKMGANTMVAYLLHAPVVLCLRKLGIAWQFYIIITVVFLYIIHILTKWHGALYGIVSTERRDNSWQAFKKSTKSMLSRSTDSYYP